MPAIYISSNINFILIIIIFLYFTDKKTKTREILLLFTFLSLLIFFERVVYIHFLCSLLTQFLLAVWLPLSPRCKTSWLTFSGFVRVDPVLFLEIPSSISGTWLSWFNFYCSSCSLYTLCSLNKDEILFHSKWTWWLPCSLMVKYLNLSNQDHRSYSWLKHISLIFALCILISFFPDFVKAQRDLPLLLIWERTSRLEFTFDDAPVSLLCKCMMIAVGNSAACFCWLTPTSGWLALWSFQA